ncbi:ferrous iron transport protein B [bacterium]|nr:ferrous iron transport protein B [bacterium]
MSSPRRVALVGNPNTGKTTLFNALTGFRAKVGNYAGVTVERKSGPLKGGTIPAEIIDLPGTYSLSARSADEMVAVDVLLGHRSEDPTPPDLVLVVLDASNLERNLFLATQIFETGLPCALVLNMMDMAETNGISIDTAELERRLSVRVFPVVASKGTGLDALRQFICSDNAALARSPQRVVFPEAFDSATTSLGEALTAAGVAARDTTPFLLRRALLEVGGMAEQRMRTQGGDKAAAAIDGARATLQQAGHRLVSLEAKARYASIRGVLDGVVKIPEGRRETTSDRIDRVLIHPVWGVVVFMALMLVVFQAIYSWSAPFMDLIDGCFGWLSEQVTANMSEGPLASFLADGVIAGVGGVVIFLPQIIILFLFISILEDCGYMARAAFLADRLLSRLGLSGRSFIPMLSSFACAIPGVMATRTIEDPRDRLTTIMVAPLMSCSARLPVYALMIGAFIPAYSIGGVLGLQGLVLFAMYLVGPAVAIPVALLLRRSLLKGPKPTFLMELPPYRRPNWKQVGFRLLERAGAFLKRAGTVIFAVSVVVWAATYYPRPAAVAESIEARYAERIAAAEGDTAEELTAERDRAIEGAYLRQSILGRMGSAIEPLVRPLGWDWRIGMAVIASFPAREVVVSTLGIIFDVGSDADEESDALRDRLVAAQWADGSPIFTIPVAVSIMVFFALCAQCAATLAIIRRETNSWRWPIFAFVYMTTLAWIGALLVYQVGTLIAG